MLFLSRVCISKLQKRTSARIDYVYIYIEIKMVEIWG